MNRIAQNLTFISFLAVSVCCSKPAYSIPDGSIHDAGPSGPAVVELKGTGGKWELLCNGTPMYINGAACNNYYGDVAKFGGNAFRIYSCVNDNTIDILNEAYENGLYVMVGIYIKRETDGFDYNNEEAVRKQFEEAKACVEKFRNHPAVLMWSIGNEAEASYKNKKLWTAINDIAAMIHETDPNHPTATVLASANPDHVKNILEMAPEVDVLCINSYAPTLPTVYEKISGAGWKKPYMITEFGPRGTWQMSPEPSRMLSWGALVEESSTEKEEVYKSAWTENIKAFENRGCIGSFVFVWGYQTHGEVLNWYGLFNKERYSYGAVDAMQFCWTGKYPEIRAPRIKSRDDMTMNGKKAEDEIKVKISSANTAKVIASAQEGISLRYSWRIFKEGDHTSDGSMPDGIPGLIENENTPEISFRAPDSEGGYRLYVFVLDDKNKKVASAAIPFYVEK